VGKGGGHKDSSDVKRAKWRRSLHKEPRSGLWGTSLRQHQGIEFVDHSFEKKSWGRDYLRGSGGTHRDLAESLTGELQFIKHRRGSRVESKSSLRPKMGERMGRNVDASGDNITVLRRKPRQKVGDLNYWRTDLQRAYFSSLLTKKNTTVTRKRSWGWGERKSIQSASCRSYFRYRKLAERIG